MVKKSQTPAGTVLAPWGFGQGADRVYRRCGCARWVGGGGCQQGGFDLDIGSDGFFELSGFGWPDPKT